jgi:hypothetical protein
MIADRRPGQLVAMGGTFDDPNWLKIDRHNWIKSKVHWMEITADATRSKYGARPVRQV